MALNITTQDEGVMVVMRLQGRLVLGEETSAFRTKVKSLLNEGKKVIVVSLLEVSVVDSSGVGALVSAHSSAKAAGASLRLCDLGARFSELLQVTKLYTIFEIYETEHDAFRAVSDAASAD